MFIDYVCMGEQQIMVKAGSQYDTRASVVSWALGLRWNRLNFYSSIASPALASVNQSDRREI